MVQRPVSARTKKIRPEPLTYVMSRNARGRPGLMHQLEDGSSSLTLCGRSLAEHSRVYLNYRQAAPLIQLMCCKRCGTIAGRY